MSTTTSPTETFATAPAGPADRFAPAVTFDLYRDIHKGIRAELFAVTGAAGSTDPGDRTAVAALADHVRSVADMLEVHAHHEDEGIDPVLQVHLPELAEQIDADHQLLDRRVSTIAEVAATAVDAADPRRFVQGVYLELASFVSAYLTHQDLEERVVMPKLEAAIGVEAVIGIHGRILGAIPPAEMAASLAVMLPAMNIDDRVELLGGMRQSAPPEAFEQTMGLAATVLVPADLGALRRRLGL